MNCSDFQANLELYLDGELDAAVTPPATAHVAGCRACRHIMTEHETARALLVTAVADRAAAVDVSGLWEEISHRLDESEQPRVTSLATFRHRRARDVARGPFSLLQVGLAAAAAAAIVFAVTFGKETSPPPKHRSQFAQSSPAVAPPNITDVRFTTGSGAIAQSRPVRIDSMEIGAGHTVSTWIKPRTKTRVIWVANADFGVENVSQSR